MICLVCGWESKNKPSPVEGRIFNLHLKQDHNLSRRKYYEKYLMLPGEDICKCGCGEKSSWNKSSQKYNQTFNRDHQLRRLRLKYPSMTHENGKKVHIIHPNLASELGKKNGPSVTRVHNEFRRKHGGQSVIEWEFFQKTFIQDLFLGGHLIPQDKRFLVNKGRQGSGGIVMDFSVPRVNLCIELDGKWGHSKEMDSSRDTWLLKTHGWRTIRFKNEEAMKNTDAVFDQIKQVIKECQNMLGLTLEERIYSDN